mmetsp:Transcript_9541/g.7975  ORF Transcript_9541/g.7975 Transcript_9541/m.7975 type:complete len:94 (+) Transcript_9541:135-416(+)
MKRASPPPLVLKDSMYRKRFSAIFRANSLLKSTDSPTVLIFGKRDSEGSKANPILTAGILAMSGFRGQPGEKISVGLAFESAPTKVAPSVVAV